MGTKNGWQGIIINGCLRDSEDIGRMNIGVKALSTHPLKSSKRDPGGAGALLGDGPAAALAFRHQIRGSVWWAACACVAPKGMKAGLL